MTNYERIKTDKAFCAMLLADGYSSMIEEWTEWLDTEQIEVSDEQEDV